MRIRVIVILVSLLVAAGVVARANRAEEVPMRQPLSGFPIQIDAWRGAPEPPFTKEVLDVLRVDDYLTRVYFTRARQTVGLYIGFWQSQRHGDSIHSPLNCLPGAGWQPISQGSMRLDNPRGAARPQLDVNRYLIQKGADRLLVLYWYQSHGRIVASEYWSKFYLIADAVRSNRTDGAIVRITSEVKGDSAQAERDAEQNAVQFATLLLPQLDGFLPD